MDLGSLAQMGQSMLKNAGGAPAANDKTAEAITAMIPKEMLDKLPPAARGLITKEVIDAAAKQAPELLAVLGKGGKLTGSDAEKLKSIVIGIVQKNGK